MGATQSQLQIHKQHHFERSISNIFNGVKIISFAGISSIVGSIPNVIINSDMQSGFVLVCNDGSLHFVLSDTLNILFSTKLRLSSFLDIQKVGTDSFVLISNENIIFTVKVNKNGFEIHEIEIENPVFVIDINDSELFAVVDNNCNTFLCKFGDRNVKCLWKDISDSKPNSVVFGEINDEKIIIISSQKLIVGYIKEGEKPVFHNIEPLFTMKFFDNEIFCLDENKKKLFIITLQNNLSIQFTETIYNGNSISDIEFIDENTIVGCNLNNIFAYDGDILNVALNIDVNSNKIMKFNSRIFIVFCTNGTIIVCRVENQQNGIVYHILKNIHQCEIKTICKVNDYSFLTVDINNHIVLWESLDDWWDAPFYSSSF